MGYDIFLCSIQIDVAICTLSVKIICEKFIKQQIETRKIYPGTILFEIFIRIGQNKEIKKEIKVFIRRHTEFISSKDDQHDCMVLPTTEK